MDYLCEEEQKSGVVRSMIYIFHKLNNQPSNAEDLAKIYIDMKDGIHQRKAIFQDRCTGVRSNPLDLFVSIILIIFIFLERS